MISLINLTKNSDFNTTIRFCCLLGLIFIQSCANPPQPRPKAITDAEYFLQHGTAAFYNDEYPDAANSFTQALKIYRSIDNASGMMDSHINLMETSLAIGNLALAHQQLQKIDAMLTKHNRQKYLTRITLLKVKLLFSEQHFTQAINTLQPLLPTFNAQQQVHDKSSNTLNILSSMARLVVLTQRSDASLWLQRLQIAITHNKHNNERFRALYLRINALQKQQEGELDQAKTLLNEALSIYHSQAYRRGIAASLQQLANVEIQQKNWNQADRLLQRALKIHLWTLHKRESKKVLESLVNINKKLKKDEMAQSYAEQLDKLK